MWLAGVDVGGDGGDVLKSEQLFCPLLHLCVCPEAGPPMQGAEAWGSQVHRASWCFPDPPLAHHLPFAQELQPWPARRNHVRFGPLPQDLCVK